MNKLQISFVAAALAVALVRPCTPASAGPSADAPQEPTYEAACKNWTPLTGRCVVMAPKNGRSKFVSGMNGDVHTVYVSEVLGDCPLLPSLKPLEQKLSEGIQINIGTGVAPNFRLTPSKDVRQRLVKGSLPMVTTTWKDTNKLSYEQLAFVRLIGNKLDVTKGDENAAAFIRLRVRNKASVAQKANLWLSICGSSNGQGRGVGLYEYRGQLHLGKDRIANENGELRLQWNAPVGAVVETSIREKAPVPQEWGVKTSVPGHGPLKAFDKMHTTFWAPTLDKLTEPVGIGIMFPERRWIRAAHILSRATTMPTFDGHELQYFDGKTWIPINGYINGKTMDELRKDPEIYNKFLDMRSYLFEPVQAEGLRLMVTKMPEGKPYPIISSFDYVYNLDSNAGKGKWFSTYDGDPMSNYIHFTVDVPAGGYKDLVLKIPFAPASKVDSAWLNKQDFDKQAKVVSNYWLSEINKGAKVSVPESVVQEVWDSNIPHMFVSSDKDQNNGLYFKRTSVGWYDAVWGNLAGAEIMALDMRGHHEDAGRYLETFLKWQGKSTPPGNFKSKAGFLSSADEYTWVRWTSNHGWLLWALSEHYMLTGDNKWLGRVMPNILAACDWVQRERARTKISNPDGTRPPEWGLLPPNVTGDGAPPCYSFTTDAYTWAGFNAAATLLREIKHPRAAEITSDVKEYKDSITNAVQWATDHAKPYRLTNGKEVPLVPIDLQNTWNISNENQHGWYLDVGPMHLVDCGVIDARSNLANLMMQVSEDHWLKYSLAIDEPWYAPQRAVYLGRDQINRFLDVYYNELAEGMDRQVYSPVEGHNGVQNLPWADGENTRFVRMMLVQEDGDALLLCRATPRAWLKQGKSISVRNMPTHFGDVSFSIRSNVSKNRITASVTCSSRKLVPIKLRIRHPEAKQIKALLLNGKAYKGFSGEWVNIPKGLKMVSVELAY